MGKIKFLVMDVDGTLTDGKIYMGVEGEVMKAFDIKDGYALHTLLKEQGIIPVIITARKSLMVEHRCKELGVTEIHQGVMRKLDCLNEILKKYSSDDQYYQLSHVAYIGDDHLDLLCMNPIKAAGGLIGCPYDAIKEVRAASDYISPFKGGEGAVRDFSEYIIFHNQSSKKDTYDILKKRIDNAIEYISKLDFSNLKVGKYEVTPEFYYCVQEYNAFEDNDVQYESHRKFIDVQWVYEGTEKLYVTDIRGLIPCDNYNEDKDVIHYYDNYNMSAVIMNVNSCFILFPKDAHKSVCNQNRKCMVRKVVGKLKI